MSERNIVDRVLFKKLRNAFISENLTIKDLKHVISEVLKRYLKVNDVKLVKDIKVSIGDEETVIKSLLVEVIIKEAAYVTALLTESFRITLSEENLTSDIFFALPKSYLSKNKLKVKITIEGE